MAPRTPRPGPEFAAWEAGDLAGARVAFGQAELSPGVVGTWLARIGETGQDAPGERPDPESVRRLARMHERLGDRDRADDLWRRLAADTADSEAVLRVARASARAGDWAAAAASCDALLDVSSPPPEAARLRLEAAIRLSEALPKNAGMRLLATNPRLLRSMILEALAASPKLAVDTLASLADARCTLPWFKTLLAEQEHALRAAFDEEIASGEFGNAWSCFRILAFARPEGHAEAFRALRACAAAAMQRAVETLDEARLTPCLAFFAEEPRKLASATFCMGRIKLLKGDIAGAVPWLERSVALDDQKGWVWLNLARALQDTADFSGALGAFRRVVALPPRLERDHQEAASGIAALTRGAAGET